MAAGLVSAVRLLKKEHHLPNEYIKLEMRFLNRLKKAAIHLDSCEKPQSIVRKSPKLVEATRISRLIPCQK